MQKKKMWVSILLITIIIWVVWLPLATSNNFRMDSERMIFHADEALSQYISEGRFGLVALLHVFGLTTWKPILSGILFLSFFSLATWLLCYFIHLFSGKSSKFPYGLFALLYATTPVWAFHIYFVLQIAAVGFGIMLTVLLAGLDTKHHISEKKRTVSCILFELISTLFLSFSLSIYQGLIVHYLSAVSVFLFCYLLQEKKWCLREMILWAARVLTSLAIYLVAARILQGGESAYLAQQIQWGKIPMIQCILNIIIQFGKMVLLIHSGSFSLYPLALILFAVLIVHRWQSSPAERKKTILLSLVGIVIILLPMAMSVLQGSRPVPRTQFGLQIAAAFFPACYIAHTNGKHSILRILCILAIGLQIILNVRLLHTDNMRNQQDAQAIQTISATLEETQDKTKPLIFMGALSFEDDTFLMEKTDVYGLSFFEWIYDTNVPGSASPSAIRLLRAYSNRNYRGCSDPALISKASLLVQSLPAYPQDGYLIETEDYILIKLSE